MNARRLDQILLELGYVTEDQLRRALRQQEGLGGRIGSHLVYAGALSEAQLTHALAVQHGVPPYRPDAQAVARDVLRRLPAAAVRRLRFLPLGLDAGSGRLSVVLTDPGDQTVLNGIRRLTGCAALSVHVAADVTFDNLLDQHLAGVDAAEGDGRGIALPDLFAAGRDDEAPVPDVPADGGDSVRDCLLVSRSAFLRDFLVPVFARERVALTVAADRDEAAVALAAAPSHVLVAEDMRESFTGWVRRGEVPAPVGRVGEFHGVSAGLLDNPAPYRTMLRCLLAALAHHRETVAAQAGPQPPYGPLRRDVRRLAEAVGLPPLATDALEVAVLCLAPAEAGDGERGEHAVAWSASLAHLRSLRLPWDGAPAVAGMRELLSERVHPGELGASDHDGALAAQVLAMVWQLHTVLLPACAARADRRQAVREGLRAGSGRLATAEVVETCLRVVLDDAEETLAAARHQILVVGDDPTLLGPTATRLKHLGYHVLTVTDADEARRLCRRQPPTALLVLAACLPRGGRPVRDDFALDDDCGLYVVTPDGDPSHMLSLFDAGCDDVFCLPRDAELLPARLRRAIGERAEAGGGGRRSETGFQASFAAIGFTDLLQTLAQSQKSVRLDLRGGDGEQAIVHLAQGRLVHAACGDAAGPAAIYRVIAWGEDGAFAVEPVTDFPSPNVNAPLEAVLMEGCRLLDESRV